MKKFKVLNLPVVAVCLLALSSTFSCSDEPFYTSRTELMSNDNSISFYALLNNDQNTENERSRSGENTRNDLYSSFKAEPIEGSNLYLLTCVEDKIDRTPFAKDDESEANESRSNKITDTNIRNTSSKGIDLYAFTFDGSCSSHKAAVSSTVDGVKDGINYLYRSVYLSWLQSGDGSAASLASLGDDIYWGAASSTKNITFYGLYPAVSDFNDTSESAEYALELENDDPYLTVEVEPLCINEDDVLLSEDTYSFNGKKYITADGTKTDNSGGIMKMHMKHLMTAVQVELGDGLAGKNIYGVIVNNVYTKGQYKLFDEKWVNQDTKTNPRADLSSVRVTSMKSINRYFMMVPQTLPDDASITVRVKDSATGDITDYTAPISGEWKAGTTVNYVLSDTSTQTTYVLETLADVLYFSWDGTPAGYGETDATTTLPYDYMRLKSYKAVTNESGTTYTAVPWTITADSDDAINYPTSSPDASTTVPYAKFLGEITSDDYNYSISALLKKQDPVANPSAEAEWADKVAAGEMIEDDYSRLQSNKNNVLGSASNRIDLSYCHPDGTPYNNRYTSNCYMVNYPGYYEIPIVYGNGIFNDQCYKESYTWTLSPNEYYAMNPLVNYNGNPINSQYDDVWITYWNGKDYYHFPGNDGNGTSGRMDACISWQDVDPSYNTLTIVNNRTYKKSNTEEYFLQFNVASGDNFRPGNFVIKILNKNNVVLWSYHIWITPNTNKDIIDIDSNPLSGISSSKNFLRVPLGHVQEPIKWYKKRTVNLTITQEGSGLTKTLELRQAEHVCAPQSCTYYQWGRKDPFPGALISEPGHLDADQSYKVEVAPKTFWTQDIDSNGKSVSALAVGSITVTAAPSASSNPDGVYGYTYCIKNPLTFYSGYRFPDYNYWNLWGCSVNLVADTAEGEIPNVTGGTSAHKTIYDPCPAGYRLPGVYELPAVTYDGKNHSSVRTPISNDIIAEEDLYKNWINTPFTGHDDALKSMGYIFYRRKMSQKGKTDDSGGTFTLPALGVMNPWTASYDNIGNSGYYWTSSNWTSASGTTNTREYYLMFGYSSSTTIFLPIFGNTHSNYGMPIFMIVDDQRKVPINFN